MMERTSQRGFTIIELLVAMAITSMLIAVVAMAFTGQSRSYNAEQDIVALQQNMRSALQLMAKEIRMAGYNPTSSPGVGGISIATAINLRFTQDTNDGAGGPSDGSTNGLNEDIRYAISGTGLGRETAGAGGLQLLAENIDQLAYEYYLKNDTWTQAPADVEDIRAVKIMILGHSARETAGESDTSTFRPPLASAAPPNWTPAAPGRFHWRMMSIIVQCRNLTIKA